jgi:hypothetical protein
MPDEGRRGTHSVDGKLYGNVKMMRITFHAL